MVRQCMVSAQPFGIGRGTRRIFRVKLQKPLLLMSSATRPKPGPARQRGKQACIIPTPSNTTGRVFSYHKKARGPLDFDSINRMALAAFAAVLARILPRGKIIGREYVALNPTRADHRAGS